ncbi:MAG TPA: trypsin-like peptidase domain-containing protein [Acetobacteraceae bacterium]|nr:trypsin-like peptidase domain-containing protein [Acetobacteraceae bacterium]
MSSSLSRREFGFALAFAAVAPPALAQRGLPDFADLAERVLPAVVSIQTTAREPGSVPQEFRGTPYERQFRNNGRQVRGTGSGFILDPAGMVVTNGHVVGNVTRVVVRLQDGTELPARVVGTDDAVDVAVLRIEAGRPLTAVSFGPSARLRVGQWVMAAGNPFGLGGSVSAGIVSALGRDIRVGPFDDFIQTDAPINPGNSGGPLFNLDGEVIGINTAIYSPSGANVGIGFAVPSDLARPLVEQLMRGGRVERGWLGVSLGEARGENGRRGAVVAAVQPNSPAARAGVKQGDLVVTLNGERVESSRQLVRGVAMLPPGQSVRLGIVRGNAAPREVTVQIGRRPPQGAS